MGCSDRASAFDQDLGWCVDDDVDLDEAFEGTPSTTPGACDMSDVVRPSWTPRRQDDDVEWRRQLVASTGACMVNWRHIRAAIAAWLSDAEPGATAGESRPHFYVGDTGHISTWETGVTDMSYLFCRCCFQRGQVIGHLMSRME